MSIYTQESTDIENYFIYDVICAFFLFVNVNSKN